MRSFSRGLAGFALIALSTVGSPLLAGGGSANNEVPIRGYAGAPARYIGSLYCEVCHEEQTLAFADTKMGKLFMVKPTDPISKLGCEGCHGPGSNHAISGGGVGMGGLIEFRAAPGQPIERANQACLVCHDEAFWHGKTHGFRRLACFDCHTIMLRQSPSFQLSAQMPGDWNRPRTWGAAAAGGFALGLCAALGVAIFRRRDPDA
jgi:hypothetical protein